MPWRCSGCWAAGRPATSSGFRSRSSPCSPGTTHITVVDQADLLLSMIPAFLDAPLPKD
jgi:hypothetical protein